MEGSRSLCDLPDELLVKILCCEDVSVGDVGRTAASCVRLHRVSLTPHIWRRKLRHMCGDMWEVLPVEEVQEWREEVEQVVRLGQEVERLVGGLSRRLYHGSSLTHHVTQEINALTNSTPTAPHYVRLALLRIINRSPKYQEMTIKYYAEKVLEQVHQELCLQAWEQFLALPSPQQTLEEGAILVANWFQPHRGTYGSASIKKMRAELDRLAELCKAALRPAHKNHPALSAPLVPCWEVLQDSKWSSEQCRQLFSSVNHVLYSQVKFEGNTHNYYNLENSLFDEVLQSKRGIPITLSVLYQAVCHRLGLRLEPVNTPAHFVTRWKIPNSEVYEYIDAFHGGKRLSATQLLGQLSISEADRECLEGCEVGQVFQRMVKNIIHVANRQSNAAVQLDIFSPALELLCYLSPEDRNLQEHLISLWHRMEQHHDRLVVGCRRLLSRAPSPLLQNILDEAMQVVQAPEQLPPITPCPHTSNVAFAVGLVMEHRRYQYNCVIYGWDEVCKMPEAWVRQMGVHHLQHQTRQPFYNVLVYDGSHRYAAEENLVVSASPEPVSHPEVGKYFKEFTGTHYLPNDQLEQQYPQEAELRNKLLHEKGLV